MRNHLSVTALALLLAVACVGPDLGLGTERDAGTDRPTTGWEAGGASLMTNGGSEDPGTADVAAGGQNPSDNGIAGASVIERPSAGGAPAAAVDSTPSATGGSGAAWQPTMASGGVSGPSWRSSLAFPSGGAGNGGSGYATGGRSEEPRPSLPSCEPKRLASYSVDGQVACIATADFNRDGHLDLVTGSSNLPGSSASLLLGNGDGTFAPYRKLELGESPDKLRLTDLNGDGLTDIVARTRFGETVTTALGNGDGTFRPPATLPANGSVVAVVDLNRDGYQDIVTEGFNADREINVLWGHGDGSFEPVASLTRLPASDVVLGDLNGDGNLDVVSRMTEYPFMVRLGQSDGSFAAAYPLIEGRNLSDMLLVDVNADGRLDLVNVNFDSPQYNERPNTVSVFLGNGDGTVGTETSFPVGLDPSSVTAYDLNQDGILDLVTGNAQEDSITVLLGTGDGNYHPGKSYYAGFSPRGGTAIGDFDHDGSFDVAVGNYGAPGRFYILFGVPNPTCQ